MTRNWQPGDVAMVSGLVCLYTPTGWEHGEDDHFRFPRNADARPLVVIDPEDSRGIAVGIAQAVGSALNVMLGSDISAGIDAVQRVLREYADPKPPKPEEPTAWLAAVEDADDQRWYRDGRRRADEHPWRQQRDDDIHARRNWGDIDAVKVLSEGVTP